MARFEGLVFSRYVASCWIVGYHYYGHASFDGPEAETGGVALSTSQQDIALRVLGWGTLWTQYFFFLSGFVLATARLSSARPDDLKPTLRFVADRLSTTYPLYLLSLVLMLWNRAYAFGYMTATDFVNLGLHVLLLQAWWPDMVCAWRTSQHYAGHTVNTGMIHWNTPAWFMSALLFYWFLFKPLYRCLRLLPRRYCVPAFVGLWCCSWAAAVDMRWRGLTPKTANLDFYRYNPLMHVHVFAAGMVFARIFHEADDVNDKVDSLRHSFRSFLVAHGATVGYAVVAVCAAGLPVKRLAGAHRILETGRFYFFHNGGLVPLFALLIAGLCSDRDPVTVLFKKRPLLVVGAISYAQYILQAVMFRLADFSYDAARMRRESYQPYPYGPWTWQFVLPGTLFFTSFVAHYCFSVPLADYWRRSLTSVTATDGKPAPQYAPAQYGAVDTRPEQEPRV